MKIIRLSILLICSNIFAQDDLSLIFYYDQIISPVENANQKSPDMITDMDGVLHITWVEQIAGHKNIRYCKSEDGGATFTSPTQVNNHNNSIIAYNQAGPKIRIRGDELLIIYMDNRTGTTSPYLSRSLDGGDNWLQEIMVSDQPHLNLYPDIEIDSSGNIHVIYYNYNANYFIEDVRYTYAPPGTIDFVASISTGLVNDEAEPCDCCQPDLAISENDDLYIAYRNNINNIRDHYLVVKPVGDDFFSESIRISTYNDFIDFCPSSGPSIAFNGNTIAVSYMVYQNLSSYINYSSLDELSFNNEINVQISDAMQNYPQSILHNNFIHSSWVDFSNGSADIYYGLSEIGSGEIQNVQRVHQFEEDNGISQLDQKILWDNEFLYCLWSDQRDGHFQIYISKTSADAFVQGDVNQDGEIDVLDIIVTVNLIHQSDYNAIADLNGDGLLNVLDIIQLINLILFDSDPLVE